VYCLTKALPCPSRRFLKHHAVRTAGEQGWSTLRNSELLDAAENAGFELPLTTDKNLVYQQNLSRRRIAIVVLGNSQWPIVQHHVRAIIAAVDAAGPGSYVEVDIPRM